MRGDAVMKRTVAAAICVASLALSPVVAVAGDAEDIRAAFDRFVAAQNAHDVKAVAGTLKEGDDFLWITRGAPVWGHESALKRFEALYQGTWSLQPAMDEFRVILLGPGAGQIFVPVTFQIGLPGQPAQSAQFLMNQTYVETPSGWRVASILPIPVPR